MVTYVRLAATMTPNEADPAIVLPSGLAGARLQVEAFDASDNPLDIFVYQVEALDLYEYGSENPNTSAMFMNVASPNDIEELPIGVPPEASEHTLFMLPTLDVVTRSIDEARFIWDEIVADVRGLVRHGKLLTDPPPGSAQSLSEVID